MKTRTPILTVKRLPKSSKHPETNADIGLHWVLSVNGQPLITDIDHSFIFKMIFEIEYYYQQKD